MSIMEGALSEAASVNNPVSSPTHPLSETIRQTLERLRSLSQVSVQSGWRYFDGDLPLTTALDPKHWQKWKSGKVNAKDHHPWVKGRKVRWFSRQIQVPHDLHGYPLEGMCLRLALLWWSEDTQVYVNGQLVQEGDLFDCAPRLLLSESVKPGDEFAIALRMVSPIHDDGALMKSVCHYEAFSPNAPLEPAFIANELAVLQSYLEQFEPEKLEILANAIAGIDWNSLQPSPASSHPSTPPLIHPSTHPPLHSLPHLRQTLTPLAAPLKQRQITLLGHAHLDMAWLWTVAETWKAAERTFQSVLNLQKDFPELTFAHTTPALYEWMEQNRPDLFAQIQEQVKAGKWEIVAGFWIEPELNLISGESIARQVLYGQRYIQEKFGKICPIAWVPDTFGFTWQLPQILKQGGVDYFVTQKLRWNDTTKFPYELFQWQAPDGTQILSLMSSPIGEFIDPVKMANFAWEFEQKTGLQTALWLPGVGDHGGGPTRDMLEVARRWQQSPFFPQMEFGTALEYLEEVRSQKSGVRSQEITAHSPTHPLTHSPTHPLTHSPLPVWNSELYLEYHRGCYTTHADQKKANRRAEDLLYQTELWASLANITAGVPYPKAELEVAWKKTLFNQFHDILPGSSITQVFVEANQTWEDVQQICSEIIDRSLTEIAAQIKLSEPPHPDAVPIMVFNPSNWERSQVVKLPLALYSVEFLKIYNLAGELVAHEQKFSGVWLFLAANIPPVGYRLFWLHYKEFQIIREDDRLPTPPDVSWLGSPSIENDFLRVTINPTTGDLASIFDKTHQHEILSDAGNQLQAFEDKGQYWDAWNIDPTYAQHPLPATEFRTFFQQGEVSSFLQVVRKIGNSKFHQDYILEANSNVLKIETRVTWQERHTLVKTAFPLNLESDFATYEIPCGAIQRTTKPQTEAEKAQWEVPAMRWADLSDGKYGVSLLNDCKYGYDAKPNQLRLTLLRGSEWPDPEADKGQHTFTYAIYPHAGDWKQAQTVRRGYELNMPLHVVQLDTDKMAEAGTLPPVGSLLDLGAENLVLIALKQAEDSDNEWILRCYECHGEEAQLNFHSDLNLKLEHPVDLLERPLDDMANRGQTVTIRPWQIASFKMTNQAMENL